MRRCIICSKDKDDKDFYIRKQSRGLKHYSYIRKECKECTIKRTDKYYKDNFERRRIIKKNWADRVFMPKLRQKLYGLSPLDFNNMKESQDNKCVICNEICEKFNVDHCHKSGHIRGLLCQGCNLGLGNFKDSIIRLQSAIIYLRRSSQPVNKMT